MQPRHDRLIKDRSHDPTKPARSMPGPAVCPDCGATYLAGRWTWQEAPADAPQARCTACQRKLDDYPAGFVRLRGAFAQEHRAELLQLAHNTEAREKETHPINRIIKISESDEEIVVTTTEIHLAQALGKAIKRAFQGRLEIAYDEDIVRVDWSRES